MSDERQMPLEKPAEPVVREWDDHHDSCDIYLTDNRGCDCGTDEHNAAIRHLRAEVEALRAEVKIKEADWQSQFTLRCEIQEAFGKEIARAEASERRNAALRAEVQLKDTQVKSWIKVTLGQRARAEASEASRAALQGRLDEIQRIEMGVQKLPNGVDDPAITVLHMLEAWMKVRDVLSQGDPTIGGLSAALAPPAQEVPGMDGLVAHLARQAAWSNTTFGPGRRTQGVVDHIRKELAEIEAAPDDLNEWIDVAILALDGAWRTGATPGEIVAALVAKQTNNENRIWPDWRTADPNKAIEHDRTRDAVEKIEDGIMESCAPDGLPSYAHVQLRLISELRDAMAQVQRRDLLLQGLTPMGSEYVNDPERCAAYAHETRRAHFERWKKTALDLKASDADRDRLREVAKINLATLVLARDAVKVLERYTMHNPTCPKFKLKPGKCTCGLDTALQGASLAEQKGKEDE